MIQSFSTARHNGVPMLSPVVPMLSPVDREGCVGAEQGRKRRNDHDEVFSPIRLTALQALTRGFLFVATVSVKSSPN
jgi:hypothetical protein